MSQQLFFDTSALIEFERGNAQVIALFKGNLIATSAIAVMEFNQGSGAVFERVFPDCKIIAFDQQEANIAASAISQIRSFRLSMLKDKTKGSALDFMAKVSLDLMIGATALHHGYTIVHRNKKDFEFYKSKGLKTIDLE